MTRNYEINKKTILDDYYICLGAFKNCCLRYEQKENFKILETDTSEEVGIKKGMEADLLSNLGKVGEKAFKYIIGLEYLKKYPNQNSENFEQLWTKDGPLKDFALKHKINIDSDEFKAILNYKDDNRQKAHNFDYWYQFMNLTMKDIADKFEKFIQYTIQSDILIKHCEEKYAYKVASLSNFEKKELSIPFRAAIFPYLIEIYDIDSIPQNELNVMLVARRTAIKKNGDIFTRLRYASNNPQNKTFNLDEAFEIIKNIILFIEMIHKDNDNLNFDLNKLFAKSKSLEYAEYLNVSEEEINDLFNLDLTGNELALTIYEERYPYKNLKKLLDVGVPKEDLRKVMRERLQARSIAFFYQNVITDYRRMRELIDYYIEYGNYPLTEPTLRKILK